MARFRILIRAFAATAACAMLLASAVAVVADTDSDGDGVPDLIEQATQRNDSVTVAGDEFNISSQLVNAPFQDRFELSYQSGKFRLYYERPGSSSYYELELQNLVEWRDLNGNDRIDPGDPSEVVVTTALGDVAFRGALVNRSRTDSSDGGVVNTLRIESRTGELVLTLTKAERFMRVGNRVLTPMEVKLDISVNSQPATAGDSLGLEWLLDTDQGVEWAQRSWDDEHGFADDEAAVNVTGGNPGRPASVFFAWSKTALAGSLPIPVGVTNITTEPTYEIYMAYSLRGAILPGPIVHDPVLGVHSVAYDGIVARSPELQGDVALYIGTLAAVAALVALTIVFAKRRRKKRED
ncbi:MAG TPA: hypothetical protein VEM77_05410 [Thermoplasmata archaeon]|nr:hypothetical protein [Thermoplasmata archaeon]